MQPVLGTYPGLVPSSTPQTAGTFIVPPSQTAASRTPEPERGRPWLRRSAAVIAWIVGFAVAIGLVVAAVLIPVGFTVATATSGEEGTSAAQEAGIEETEVAEEVPIEVTLEATADGPGEVTWETDGEQQEESFDGSWSRQLQVPSGNWPRVTVTGDTDDDDLELTCSIKVDDEVVFERRGTDSTETASCSVFV